jgi:hypothetical protein
MNTQKWQRHIKLYSLLLLAAVSQVGCAFGYFGKAEV